MAAKSEGAESVQCRSKSRTKIQRVAQKRTLAFYWQLHARLKLPTQGEARGFFRQSFRLSEFASPSDLDPARGRGDDVAHFLGEQLRVVVDEQKVRH
jgi:hypothetical protein